jgi:hypothetical protein
MNEGQNNDFEEMFIKKNVFEKQKKSIWNGLLKTSSKFDSSKVHNYYLVKVLKKIISHLIW